MGANILYYKKRRHVKPVSNPYNFLTDINKNYNSSTILSIYYVPFIVLGSLHTFIFFSLLRDRDRQIRKLRLQEAKYCLPIHTAKIHSCGRAKIQPLISLTLKGESIYFLPIFKRSCPQLPQNNSDSSSVFLHL